jgi:hypothetical protein
MLIVELSCGVEVFVGESVRRKSMRTLLIALSFAAATGLMCGATANAMPADGGGVGKAAAASSPLAAVQYSERRTRHGVVKCYRDLVVGPYRCHHFRNGEVSFPF